MDNENSVRFLFLITNEIKRSYESPVIFLTMKDYEDQVFDTMVRLRRALQESNTKNVVQDIVNELLLDWLRAIGEIDNFRKQMRETPRESIQKAAIYTIECLKKRNMYLARYAKKSIKIMSNDEQSQFEAELEIADQMMYSTTAVLTQKQLCFQYQVDQTEFIVRLNYEVEELLIWVDHLYNNLVFTIVKVLVPNFLEVIPALEKPIKDIQNKFKSTEVGSEMLRDILKPNSKSLMDCGRFTHDLEISKLKEKLNKLNSRLKSLMNNKGIAAIGLKHQIVYLEDRLNTLEHMKLSLACLGNKATENLRAPVDVSDRVPKEIEVFSHYLPEKERYQLIEILKKQWDDCLFAELYESKSISLLTLLSFTEKSELFSDVFGQFIVDKHGRKLYNKIDDDTLYQHNERRELVPLDDEDGNIYYYDDCGRYYLNAKGHRIYKADRNSSEYMMHRNGRLIKWKECEDDIEFYFDNLGRYYLNDVGKRIYREKDGDYESDGLGNLVKIGPQQTDYKVCPQNIKIATEESKYLKKEVGTALKLCIRDVILHQPEDPVKYLVERLITYRSNEMKQQEMKTFDLALKEERELHKQLEETNVNQFAEECEEEGEDFCVINMREYARWNSDSTLT